MRNAHENSDPPSPLDPASERSQPSATQTMPASRESPTSRESVVQTLVRPFSPPAPPPAAARPSPPSTTQTLVGGAVRQSVVDTLTDARAAKPVDPISARQTIDGTVFTPSARADAAQNSAAPSSLGGRPSASPNATLDRIGLSASEDAAAPADGVDRNLALARVQQRMLGVSTAPIKIGRFVVIKKLGQGAMGIVYLGYDPKLDRKVALKLVDTSALGSEVGDAQIRLEREAKAAAALGHPNVVTVYDVGTQDGDVFLAMEYVEGKSLTEWMEQEHDWRTIVSTFVEIARGLGAAHEAGLIHRDFKPDNVLMGHDARPRVADFGLARPTAGWSAHDAKKMLSDGQDAAPRDARPPAVRSIDAMASTGEVCGTPAYMAPEQYSGIDVSAASDQFGYCASLFQALFGVRPFQGESVTELAIAVIENNRQPLPKTHRVPKAVVQVVLKGLEPLQDQRHASMHALADRLEATLRARTRNLALGGAALVASLGIGFGAQASNALVEQPCEAARSEIETSWNPERRSTIETSLARAGLPTDVLPVIDGFASSWTQKRVDSCEAARVRGELSDEGLQLRMACLDRARMSLDTAQDVLVSRPTNSVLEAVPIALGDLADCEAEDKLTLLADALETVDSLGPEAKAAWKEAQELSSALTLRRSEPATAWLPLAGRLAQIGDDHDIPQAAAEGHAFLAEAATIAGDHEEAARELGVALPAAVKGMDDVASKVMDLQARTALERDDLSAAALAAEHALAFAGRQQNPKARSALEINALVTIQEVRIRQGNKEQARKALEALLNRDDIAEIRDAQRVLVGVHATLGKVCRQLGDLPCAVEHHETSLELAEASADTIEPLELAGRYANVGLMRVDMGDAKASIEHLTRANDIVEKAVGLEHPMRAQLLCDIGGIQGHFFDPEQGRDNLLEGLALHEKLGGPQSEHVVEPLIDLSRVELRLGNVADAESYATRAVNAADASHKPEHPRRADPRLQLAQVQRAQGQYDASVKTLRVALEVLSGPNVHPMQLAEFRFELAQSLAPVSQHRAAQMAQTALDGIADFPPGKPLRDAIEGWREAEL